MNNNFSIIWGTRQLNARQIQAYVSSSVKYLRGLGLRQGQRVAICEENSVEYLILLLALWQMKVVAAPVNPKWPLTAITSYVAQISAAHLFRGVDIKRLVCFDARHEVEIIQAPEFPMDQELTIIATSGSSGESKPAMHTWGNHYYSAKGLIEAIPLTAQDGWLLALPLFHVAGMSILVRCLTAGVALVLASSDEVATTIERGKVTHASLVTTQLQRLLSDEKNHAALKKLKCILLGGSAIPPALVERSVKLGLNIYLSYGLTEMSSTVAIQMSFPNISKLTSSNVSKLTSSNVSELSFLNVSKLSFPNALVGNLEHSCGSKLLPYRELKIASDGEVLVKGDVLFKGYIAGNKIILPTYRYCESDPTGPSQPDSIRLCEPEGRSNLNERWFPTGDLGSLDENGCLLILGRKDNMFISGGENIQPEEIEKVLLSFPGIEEAVVVPCDDNEFGARPIAYLRLSSPNVVVGDLNNNTSFCDHLKTHLPKFKIPTAFYPWPQDLISKGIKITRKDFSIRM